MQSFLPESGTRRKLFAAVLLVVALLLAFVVTEKSGEHAAGPPPIMLWAWERPEELSHIDSREAGVAFLAKTLRLKNNAIIVRPRLQPLSIPAGTYLMAVVRIESDRSAHPLFSTEQREKIVSEIIALTDKPTIAAIQVDFDAKVSERAFYRELLITLRSRLPAAVKLSMTALASWCIHDDWLADLPVDEVVPMLFRLGGDRRQVLLHLQSGGDFRTAIARRSMGIATDEPLPRLPGGRRIYIFRPQAWSSAAAQAIIQQVKQWQ